jgi:hypothetical protein
MIKINEHLINYHFYSQGIKSREERSKLPFDSKYEKIENNFMDDYTVKEENESMFKVKQ